MFAAPIFTAVVCFVASKNFGSAGNWGYLMSAAFFFQGLYFFYYLWLLGVTETVGGLMLPMAFRRVLFVDVFGWARHSGNWWRRLKGGAHGASIPDQVGVPCDEDVPMPAVQVIDSRAPKRPEDLDALESGRTASMEEGEGEGEGEGDEVGMLFERRRTTQREERVLRKHDSFSPHSFVGNVAAVSQSVTGEVKPGVLPWRSFFWSTICLACLWWAAAIICIVDTYEGDDNFVDSVWGGTLEGQQSVATYILRSTGEIVTEWPTPMMRPKGLACDEGGVAFLTSGRTEDGRSGILHGLLSTSTSTGEQLVSFEEAPLCSLRDVDGDNVQDIALAGCSRAAGCDAFMITRQGKEVVSCRSHQETSGEEGISVSGETSVPLARGWLHGDPLFLQSGGHQEVVSSLTVVPCGHGEDGDCFAVGTSHHRAVRLGKRTRQTSQAASSTWVPRHQVVENFTEPVGPGMMASVGKDLAILSPSSGVIRVFDQEQGGAPSGVWIPPVIDGSNWASLCVGGGSVFMMDDSEDPLIWRFAVPKKYLL